MILVFSCSLNPNSRSRVLAETISADIRNLGRDVEFIDLQSVQLPMCDGGAAYGDAEVRRLNELVKTADAIVISAPVYNYDVNAAAKNLVELTGRNWTGKTVGMLLSAGGQGSYMSAMGLANSLMLDFRCLVLPRFVYTTEDKIHDGEIQDEHVEERIKILAQEVLRVADALKLP
ncbi:NAD(P)H-dependent FAD/FMN reductase [Calycomorphotria hydatis]|uniref:NAD(P)H-dependent FAD/FMN reductase n=2 Tax=Calycomorphotria hydatis TaxID=2528027 RepID=A0A517T8W1_9PLAN|nr:NAD(P)H-dependent FAD/FMN reductase [Calycomorphotria hydatis]